MDHWQTDEFNLLCNGAVDITFQPGPGRDVRPRSCHRDVCSSQNMSMGITFQLPPRRDVRSRVRRNEMCIHSGSGADADLRQGLRHHCCCQTEAQPVRFAVVNLSFSFVTTSVSVVRRLKLVCSCRPPVLGSPLNQDGLHHTGQSVSRKQTPSDQSTRSVSNWMEILLSSGWSSKFRSRAARTRRADIGWHGLPLGLLLCRLERRGGVASGSHSCGWIAGVVESLSQVADQGAHL